MEFLPPWGDKRGALGGIRGGSISSHAVYRQSSHEAVPFSSLRAFYDISPEVCYELKNLIEHNKILKEIIWSGNYVGFKGVNYIVEALNQKTKLKMLLSL